MAQLNFGEAQGAGQITSVAVLWAVQTVIIERKKLLKAGGAGAADPVTQITTRMSTRGRLGSIQRPINCFGSRLDCNGLKQPVRKGRTSWNTLACTRLQLRDETGKQIVGFVGKMLV